MIVYDRPLTIEQNPALLADTPLHIADLNTERKSTSQTNAIPLSVTHLPWRAVPGNCVYLLYGKRNL
jgi:hypothetical protein